MTVDIEKLEALATACGDLNWRAIQENWCEWAIRDDHAYIAIMRTKSAKQAGPCSDREAKAKFLCAVTPAAVLELIADSKQQAQKFKEWQASHHANYVAAADERDDLRAELAGLKTGYEAYERVNAELRAECEKLRKYGEEFASLAERRREQVEALRKDAERYRFIVDCPIRTMVALSRKSQEDDFDLSQECDRFIESRAAMSKEQSHD
ncbi:hypothetical protein ACTACV_10300 [Pseudomonas syringae]|uniref:hypothetical protein n=1 Tax=Pseudomonas syringae TaxID=317 RepID=UPI003F7547BC